MAQEPKINRLTASDGDLKALRADASNLYRRGRVKSACAVQEDLLERAGPAAQRDDYALLSLYRFSAGMEKESADILEEALERWPEDVEFLTNIGIAYLRARIFERAEGWLLRAVELAPDDANIRDGLCSLYAQTNREELAEEHGKRALQLKDVEAARIGNGGHDLKNIPVPEFNIEAPERNIIAFSLWGNADRYLESAKTNAMLVPHIYPGWTARFYCDNSVPRAVLANLMAAGAQVEMMPERERLYEGLFWRFKPAFEPDVDRYLVRDADSVISIRERLAVDEWINSDKHFHVMRGFLTHTDPMLAGLWGGTHGAVPDYLEAQFRTYLDDPTRTANCDQKFLREKLWPIARESVVVHDKHFAGPEALTFPGGVHLARDEIQRGHVGMNASVLKPRPSEPIRGTAKPRNRYIFTITPGRSGSAFLTELLRSNLPDSEVHHERMWPDGFGLDTPDLSHLTSFNTHGNTAVVKQFWKQKFSLISAGDTSTYVETSHLLAKAGLMENLGTLLQNAEVDIVLLRRDIEKTVLSLLARGDFINSGMSWAFYLDWNYPRHIVNPGPLKAYGMAGKAFWYVMEMYARAEFYRLRMDAVPGLHFHQVALEDISSARGAKALLTALDPDRTRRTLALPGPLNSNKLNLFPELKETVRELLKKFPRSPENLAASYAKSGGWLG